ncbi:MAG: HAD-IC family P-type ATPase, partial [Methylocella sp.]
MTTLISIIGGVGLFLLGMAIMTDGLKALAGTALRRILEKAAATPLHGTFWGAVITLLVQSSSATTMATIGLVSAGLLTFPQGLGLVFGANIGTTGTGWLVALLGVRVSLTAAALPIVFAGALLKLMGRGRWAAAGSAIAGFALILIGLTTLQQGMSGLADQLNPADLPSVLNEVGVVPWSGILSVLVLVAAGILMTTVMQSSTAAIAVSLSALYAGAIGLDQAMALVIGQNIGTATSSAVAAIGASSTAKRLAAAYIAFKLIAALFALIVFPFLTPIIVRASENVDSVTLLAAYHTAYNVVGVAILFPMIGPFTRMIERLVPERGSAFTKYLDSASLTAPTVAVEAVRQTLEHVLEALCSSAAVGLENAVEGGTVRATVDDSTVREASNALQQAGVFLSSVTHLPPSQEGHQWFTSTLHALDHAGRLTEAVDAIAKRKFATEGPEELHAAMLCAKSMRSAAAVAAHLARPLGPPSRSVEDERGRPRTATASGATAIDKAKSLPDSAADAIERLKRCSEELADLRVTHRRATLDSVASGTLTASAAIGRVDAIGLLDRLAHHAWRAASHLRGASAARTDIAAGVERGVNATAIGETPVWHSLSAEEVVQRLGSSFTAGLDDTEASRRLAKYGQNSLPTARKRGPLMRFLLQFNNVLVYVLLAAGFIKLMMGLWVDSSIILGVVVINGLLGFIQEGKAEKSLDSIRNLLSAEARALRDGHSRMIPAEDLVPGDIVFLESGNKVPADLRLVEVKNLRTEEAALTGESVPSDKSTAAVSAKATVGDRAGMAYSGTLVVSGRATGIVVATGSQTELGRINQLLAGVSALETPLLLQIKKFGYAITAIILVVSALTFAYGRFVEGVPFVEMFQAVTGIAVSMIPEGLPALITITLAIGVQRMASRNAIIRRLPAVETLGSVARICSDKTGTLTLMEMMVVSAVTADATNRITGEGYDSKGEVLRDGAPVGVDPVLQLLGRVSALCNDSQLRFEDGVWKVEGDPTEGALYPLAAKLGLEQQKERAAYPRIDAIPFESEHRFMATLHTAPGGGQVLLVKGAPEVIMDHCDRQEDKTGQHPPIEREHFQKAADTLAAQGERVLALAWLPDPRLKAGSLNAADLPKNLVLLGLIGLLDPPRKEAIEAVKECHAGGIRVTMITGDHKITAAAIAKMLDIGDGKTAVTGAEIAEMDTATLRERVRDVDVFARASPEHKLSLVKAIQANKQIVAMTGDGVNDAPALKKADIGVAMGIKGTEVTKEAAEMVLADDNFASITAAVKEGRTVYNNIEKAILFMLPTNVAQALVILVAIFVGFTAPITAPQILWVNMVTSVALGLVISFEPHELDVMQRLPRAVDRPILDGFGLWRVIFVGLALLLLTLWAFFWMKSQGASDELARAVAVNALVIGQVFYLLN